jgi:ankyrin repeat protein
MPMFHNKKNFFNAVRTGDAEAVAQYLTYYIPLKFDIDVPDEKGMTALNLAAHAGDVRIINMLLSSGADPDLPSRDGDAPLMSALNEKKPNAALALLEGGAKPNTHSNDYIYPIHLAAFAGDLDVVQALVAAKADLDVLIRANGRTALHWAVEKEMTSVVDCLAKAGARTDIVDKAGKTALDLAKTKPYLLKLLQKTTAAPAVPAPAPAAAADPGQNSESWSRLGNTRVAHTGVYTDIGRKITEIFNFEARERTVISENLKTGAETLSPPESFDRVNEEALKKALSEFRRLGGAAEEAAVLGTRPPKKAFNL